MERKNGIDLFKLIGAFFIMCLHTNYGSLNHEYVANLRLFSRWAVPFFFMATGFFLGNKIDNKNLDFKRIQKNVITLISILIVSSIVYMPVAYIRGASFNIENLLTGSYFHLWFIGALLTGYMFIWYLYFIKRHKLLPFISIFLIILAFFSDSYDQFLNQHFGFNMFRFLLSIPFMYIGITLAKNENNLGSYKILIGLVCTGLVIQYVEAELFFKLFSYDKEMHHFLVGTVIIAVPLFIISCNLNLRDNLFSKLEKKYSLFIYLYHPIIYLAIWFILNRIIPDYFDSIRIISPLIGFTLTLTFGVVLSRFFPRMYNIMNGRL